MRILVTGAGGFSGAEIVKRLVRDRQDVTACFGSNRGRLPPDTAVRSEIYGDLAGGLALPDRIDAVVHAAARSPAPGVSDADMHTANVEGTRRLVAHAMQACVSCFIYLSSLSVYGRIDTPVVDEATPFRDADTYGVSKRRGEEIVAAEGQGFRSLAIRLPGVIGPRSLRNWLTGVLHSAREGRDIKVFNPDAAFNNAAHVSDLADFVSEVLALDWRAHDAVTIAAAGQTTVREAVQLLVDAYGGKSRIVVENAPRPPFLVSSARASRLYGYRPMDITAMLRRFASENR
jgi:nucleoside-diphosphate-sugar epimerase